MRLGDALPEQSNALRCAKKTEVVNLEPPTNAFRLRTGEPGLSLQWLEYFPGNDEEKLSSACHRVGLKPNRSGFVLTLSVDVARANLACLEDLREVRLVYWPTEGDPSHSTVLGIDALREDRQLAAAMALAQSVWRKQEWRELQENGLAPESQ